MINLFNMIGVIEEMIYDVFRLAFTIGTEKTVFEVEMLEKMFGYQ